MSRRERGEAPSAKRPWIAVASPVLVGLIFFVAISAGSTTSPKKVRDMRFAAAANAAASQYSGGSGSGSGGNGGSVGKGGGGGSGGSAGNGGGQKGSGAHGGTIVVAAGTGTQTCTVTVTISPSGVLNQLGGDCADGIPVLPNGKWTFTTVCELPRGCSASAGVSKKLPVIIHHITKFVVTSIDPTNYKIKPLKSKLVHMRFTKRGRKLLTQQLTIMATMHVTSLLPHHKSKSGRARVKFRLA